MANEVDPDRLAAYVSAAGGGDEPAAVRIAEELMDAGTAPVVVLRDLVAAGQEVAGGSWETGQWTIAREHAATAVARSVIGRVAARIEPVPGRGVTVLAAVAEAEWHTLGSLMVAAVLDRDGWDVVTMPAGVRPGQLAAAAIHARGPAVLLVSCAQPALLPGARRLVVTSQDAGTPVVVGGRGFGRSERRAVVLGANGWAPDVTAAPEAVASAGGFTVASDRLNHHGAHEYGRLRRDLALITETVRTRLVAAGRPGAVDMATWIIRSLLASLLCDDRSILDDDLAWAESRGAPVPVLAEALAEALPQGADAAHDFLTGAAGRGGRT